jgi:addiction module HigA family antidote
MIPENRIPTHPGVILSQEFLVPLGISQVAMAAHLGVPVQRINELVRGKRGITPETAWLLSQALNTTPEFWINLQTAYDLARSRPRQWGVSRRWAKSGAERTNASSGRRRGVRYLRAHLSPLIPTRPLAVLERRRPVTCVLRAREQIEPLTEGDDRVYH